MTTERTFGCKVTTRTGVLLGEETTSRKKSGISHVHVVQSTSSMLDKCCACSGAPAFGQLVSTSWATVF